MLNIALLILATVGIYYFNLIILRRFIWEDVKLLFNNDNLSPILFFAAITWFISLGLTGTITSWCYYLNIDNAIACYILAIIGIIGLIYLLFNLNKFKNIFRVRINLKLDLYEIIILALILFLLLNYFGHCAVPWFNEDEITQYGLFTKLIAHGWTFNDIMRVIHDGFPKFAESSYATMYWASNSTLMPRIYHFINLFFNTVSLYAIARYLNCKRIWALCASALFLVTPELARLAVCLKTDSTLMGFELTSLLLLLVVLNSITWKKFKIPLYTTNLIIIAFILSVCAIAVRTSALYSFSLIALTCLVVVWKNIYPIKNRFFIYIFLAILASIICFEYFANIYYFSNPLYPLKGPWFIIFSHGQFIPKFTLQHLKYHLNIHSNLPGIIQAIYILFHIALGFETKIYAHIPWILHPISKGVAYSWLNPIILCIFITPFYFSKSKPITILTLIFLYIYIIWLSGIQYTRVILATSSLMILIAVIIANLDSATIAKPQRFIQKLVQIFIITIMVIFSGYQIYYTCNKYPNNWQAFFSAKARYQANVKLVTTPSHYIPILKDKYYPSFTEQNNITNILNTIQKPAVLVYSPYKQALFLHVFFDNAFLSLNSVKQLTELKEMEVQLSDFNCILIFDFNRPHTVELINFYKYFTHLKYIAKNRQVALFCK